MLLHYADGTPFCQGACGYDYGPATERDTTPRIIVQFKIGDVTTEGFIDTGGVYLVCHPDIAGLLDLDRKNALESARLGIRGVSCEGTLHRLPVSLIAEEGYGMEFEATVFVPHLLHGQTWGLPSILGLQGCLERIRFAVDPAREKFLFGPTY